MDYRMEDRVEERVEDRVEDRMEDRVEDWMVDRETLGTTSWSSLAAGPRPSLGAIHRILKYVRLYYSQQSPHTPCSIFLLDICCCFGVSDFPFPTEHLLCEENSVANSQAPPTYIIQQLIYLGLHTRAKKSFPCVWFYQLLTSHVFCCWLN